MLCVCLNQTTEAMFQSCGCWCVQKETMLCLFAWGMLQKSAFVTPPEIRLKKCEGKPEWAVGVKSRTFWNVAEAERVPVLAEGKSVWWQCQGGLEVLAPPRSFLFKNYVQWWPWICLQSLWKCGTLLPFQKKHLSYVLLELPTRLQKKRECRSLFCLIAAHLRRAWRASQAMQTGIG